MSGVKEEVCGRYAKGSKTSCFRQLFDLYALNAKSLSKKTFTQKGSFHIIRTSLQLDLPIDVVLLFVLSLSFKYRALDFPLNIQQKENVPSSWIWLLVILEAKDIWFQFLCLLFKGNCARSLNCDSATAINR